MYQITPKGEAPASVRHSTQSAELGATPAQAAAAVRQPDTNAGLQGSAPQTEAPALEKVDPLSPKFAILAKREKLLRSREEQIKAKEDAFKAKEAEYSSAYIPKSRLKSEALAVLSEAGISYDEITQQLLSQPGAQIDPALQDLQAKNAALEKRLEEISGRMDEGQTNAYKAAVNQLRADVKTSLAGNAEYELVTGLGQEERVVQLIEQTFKDEQRMMTIEEAAKEIEDYLLEEADKVVSIGKVKARFTPQAPAEANPAQKQQSHMQQQPMRTLTNSVGASKPLSPRDRAILAMQGKL